MRRRVARGEGPKEAVECRAGRRVECDPAHASAAGSAGRVRRAVDSRARPGRAATPAAALGGAAARGRPPAARAGGRSPPGWPVRPRYRTPGTIESGVASMADPHLRHSAASPLRAIGPSSASCRPPSGSSFEREVALRVVGASPEDVPGAPGATRHEVAVVVLRAGHLERQRVRRRRAVLLDVLAVRVARAADERPEPAALARRACPRRTPGRPRRSPPGAAAPRRAAAGSPCARGTSSRPGSARSARAG